MTEAAPGAVHKLGRNTICLHLKIMNQSAVNNPSLYIDLPSGLALRRGHSRIFAIRERCGIFTRYALRRRKTGQTRKNSFLCLTMSLIFSNHHELPLERWVRCGAMQSIALRWKNREC